LIDNYINGNFDYLEKFRVNIGGIGGLKKKKIDMFNFHSFYFNKINQNRRKEIFEIKYIIQICN